ncbi:MAG: hypothetical protein JST16_11670 [Bdellovibrionales bacterium]|nr:hypothetical protein [Bdellovibrionales bacterium]
MALSFGGSFKSEFDKFSSVKDSKEFLDSVLPFFQFVARCAEDNSHPFNREIQSWKVVLFNEERHMLYPHQVEALRGCFNQVLLSDEQHSGYCFMPTSAGKGHILMTLSGLAIGDFKIQHIISTAMPDVWERRPEIFPISLSLGLQYSKLLRDLNHPKTCILVHDTEILKQLEGDCHSLLGEHLASGVQFLTVQAMRNQARRENLKYVIVDECHWGNATEEETIQSSLIREVKTQGGKAVGFTASPYQHPNSKFQNTWSSNRIAGDLDFNYYLDKSILYPVTLREVNLQNARVGYSDGDDEVDLTEKDQVISFMADHISTVLPQGELDGPAICFFSAVIIPDMVEALKSRRPELAKHIKVLASDSAFFAEKCKELFGESILATDKDIQALKRGEKVFLISRQKLLVGLNAPYLRYCFISPTNSKITIMQGIGRLMRPIDFKKVPKKLATLFLTSLSGKKLDITGKGSEPADEDDELSGDPTRLDGVDPVKTRYTTTSMTLSEAYDLPVPVFYKTEVGFKDFINQRRIDNPNSVERLKRRFIDPEEFGNFDPIALREIISRLRDEARTQYKRDIQERDSRTEDGKRVWFCQGKKILGPKGCNRTQLEVPLEIHHLHPFTFAGLFKTLGPDGVLAWHADRANLKHLVTLCPNCHDLIHEQEPSDEEAA